jgi:hypothetical protein
MDMMGALVTIRRLLVVLGVVVFGGTLAAQTTAPAQDVVTSYLEIQAALANDSLEGVPAAAKRLAAQSAKLGAQGEPVAKAATEVAAAGDIKAAREAFKPLSDAVIAVVKADPSAPEDVKLAYCPMAKASWLQKEETIRNPYYGSSMLTCGEFRPLK